MTVIEFILAFAFGYVAAEVFFRTFKDWWHG